MTSQRIVVGVDGSPGARSALAWAADECRIRDGSLLVVHAPDAGDTALVSHLDDPLIRALDDAGESILRRHATAASVRQPTVPVSTLLSHARPPDALINLSHHADLLVVGTRGHGAITMSLLGSVSHRVAAQAYCPVAVVPEQPNFPTAPDVPARVVVGVSSAAAGRLALDFALTEADFRGAAVDAVRAWGDPTLIPDLDPALVERWRLRECNSLDRTLAEPRAHHPDVRIEVTLVNAEPADALLLAARRAQLLVVGCHHSDDRWSTRVGPVPAAILHRSRCPVVVVGSHARRPATADAPAAVGCPGHSNRAVLGT